MVDPKFRISGTVKSHLKRTKKFGFSEKFKRLILLFPVKFSTKMYTRTHTHTELCINLFHPLLCQTSLLRKQLIYSPIIKEREEERAAILYVTSLLSWGYAVINPALTKTSQQPFEALLTIQTSFHLKQKVDNWV